MYWRSRNTPVGVAAPGRITRPERVDQPELGHDEIDRHQDDRERDHQRADDRQHGRVLARELVDRQRKAAIELISSVISVATTVTNTEFAG